MALIWKQHTHNWEGDNEKHPRAQAITRTAPVWPAAVGVGRMDTPSLPPPQPAVLMETGPSVALPICHPLCAQTQSHTHTVVHDRAQLASRPMNQSCSLATSTHRRPFVACLTRQPATAWRPSSPEEPVRSGRSLIPVRSEI